MAKIYCIYDKKDNYCFSGNAQECADYLGVSRDVFYSMAAKTKAGTSRYKHNIYKLEDD